MVHHAIATTAMYLGGALAGLVIAAITTLNLHILVGLEEGYAATPGEVFQHSMILGLFDLVLLVAAPAVGLLVVAALRRRSGQQQRRSRRGS